MADKDAVVDFVVEAIEAGIAFCVFAGFFALLTEKTFIALSLWALAYTPYVAGFIMKKRRQQ